MSGPNNSLPAGSTTSKLALLARWSCWCIPAWPGARQWRRLMEDLKEGFRVRAVQPVRILETRRGRMTRVSCSTIMRVSSKRCYLRMPREIYLVGHSFGGSVAMKVAARLQGRVTKLVLLEPNPVYLLAQSGLNGWVRRSDDLARLHQEMRGTRAVA